jgi:hypothetical protein
VSRDSFPSSRRAGTAVWGLVLVALGIWFLLQSLGVPLPGMAALWPVFSTLAGVGFFASWLFSRDKRSSYGVMIPATITFLIGLFFFGFTLGAFAWGDMAYLWPVFPLIVGIAFVVTWVFSGFREWGLLVPGGVTGAVGLIGLAFTLGRLEYPYLRWILRGWPALLILIGLIVLVGGLLDRRGRPTPPADVSQQGLEDFESREYKRPEE